MRKTDLLKRKHCQIVFVKTAHKKSVHVQESHLETVEVKKKKKQLY